MDTKMEHLTNAIKSGELNQNNTIIQIQQQMDKVCSSLAFLVQQSTLQPQNRQNDTNEALQTAMQAEVPAVDHEETTAIAYINKSDASDTTRPRPSTGKSPEKKKQRSSMNIARLQSDDDHIQSEPNTQMTLDDKTDSDTDQSGAQYKCPSPSDGGIPE
jgi:hypothetical protein